MDPVHQNKLYGATGYQRLLPCVSGYILDRSSFSQSATMSAISW